MSKDTSAATKALDKVTDYVEEAHVSEDKAKQAAKNISTQGPKDAVKQIVMYEKDIDYLIKELEMDKAAAITLLRSNDGKLEKAIHAYLHK